MMRLTTSMSLIYIILKRKKKIKEKSSEKIRGKSSAK